jgi:hypothetical protein
LILEKDASRVWNKTTQQVWTYTEFVKLPMEDRTFFAGDAFHFEFIIKNTGSAASIPPGYRIDLHTNLDNPIWTYRDKTKDDPEWTIWTTAEEHGMAKIEIELDGIIPEPVSEVKEPHFKDIEDLLGIVQRELFVRIYVRDGESTPQELTNDLGLYATKENLKNFMEQIRNLTLGNTLETIDKTFENSENTLTHLSELKSTIVELAEQGHPGWAYDLSQILALLDESIKTLVPATNCNCDTCKEQCDFSCPALFFVIIGLVIGVIAGVFIGKFIKTGEQPLPNFDDQIKKLENVRKRIQQVREDESKRKIELIGPETELKDVIRRMKAIDSDIGKIRTE